jgi:hypothetical protein
LRLSFSPRLASGNDVTTPAYIEAIETAAEAITSAWTAVGSYLASVTPKSCSTG